MKRLLGLFFLASISGCGETNDASKAEGADPSALVTDTCSDVDTSKLWRPTRGMTWDWQLTSSVNTQADVDIYDIDAFLASEKLIASLHAKGRKVVCYVNVGAWEDFRPDAAQFPASVLGKVWSETKYQDEKWLDIRQLDVLGPILEARFDMAKKKGCDAIEPDNIDGYEDSGQPSDRTGFHLTYQDQLTFNRYIACEAHKRGMSVALKNDSSQVRELARDFDFVVSEQCFDYRECKDYKPFLDANKAVLVAEYIEDLGDAASAQSTFSGWCAESKKLGLSTILKKNKLDSWRQDCTTATEPAAPPDAAPEPGPGMPGGTSATATASKPTGGTGELPPPRL